MCKVLEREGRQWAIDSVDKFLKLTGKSCRYPQLISYVERGLRGKPAAFVRGIQGVIDEVRKIGDAA